MTNSLRRIGSQVTALNTPVTAAKVALLVALFCVPMLLVFHSRSRRLYIVLVLTIISSMVISPLLESQRVVAFSQKQATQQAANEKRQEDADARQEAQDSYNFV